MLYMPPSYMPPSYIHEYSLLSTRNCSHLLCINFSCTFLSLTYPFSLICSSNVKLTLVPLHPISSLVTRPLPDFISQLWRNSIILRSCEIKSAGDEATQFLPPPPLSLSHLLSSESVERSAVVTRGLHRLHPLSHPSRCVVKKQIQHRDSPHPDILLCDGTEHKENPDRPLPLPP